jgi:hypothetical protein
MDHAPIPLPGAIAIGDPTGITVGLSCLDPRAGVTAELEVARCADTGGLLIRQHVRVDLNPDGGSAVLEADIITLESPWYRLSDLDTATGDPGGATGP